MDMVRAVQLTKTFRNNVQDITPRYVAEMGILIQGINTGSHIYINLGDQLVKYGYIEDFFRNYISNNIITLKDDVIQEDVVFTSVGLVSKKEFDEATEYIEMNQSTEYIKPRNLMDNELYQLEDGRVIYHLGMYRKNLSSIAIRKDLSGSKINVNDKSRYFLEMILEDGKYIPLTGYRAIFIRKTKDKVIRHISEPFDMEKIYKEISENRSFVIHFNKNNSIGLVEREVPKTYGQYYIIKEDEEYFIFIKAYWGQGDDQVWKIKDISEFKREINKMIHMDDGEVDFSTLVERSNKTELDNKDTEIHFISDLEE